MVRTKKNILLLILSFVLVFSVFAFINTDYSYAATKTPAKVSSLKAKKNTTTGNYNLTWKKAKNAKKYQVYYSIGESSTWKLYKTTTSKSCQISRHQNSETEKYKVRAVNGKKKGKYSSIVTVYDRIISCDKGSDITFTTTSPITLTFTFNDEITTMHRVLSNSFTRVSSKLNVKDKTYTITLQPTFGNNSGSLQIWDTNDKTAYYKISLQSNINGVPNVQLGSSLPLSLRWGDAVNYTITSCTFKKLSESTLRVHIEGSIDYGKSCKAHAYLYNSRGVMVWDFHPQLDDGINQDRNGKFIEDFDISSMYYSEDHTYKVCDWFNPDETYILRFEDYKG